MHQAQRVVVLENRIRVDRDAVFRIRNFELRLSSIAFLQMRSV